MQNLNHQSNSATFSQDKRDVLTHITPGLSFILPVAHTGLSVHVKTSAKEVMTLKWGKVLFTLPLRNAGVFAPGRKSIFQCKLEASLCTKM